MNESLAPAADRAENHPIEDAELLRRYAEDGAENAFAELVRRRIDLVYSVSLRQTGGDRHRAEDATQAVFTDLARKARALAARPVLVGWLHRSAQFAAAGLVRAEQRRQDREREAHTMETLLNDQPRDADWQKLRPVLDAALNEIDERDRDAILLRFFDGRPFAEIGARLRLTENAARMRVDRALDQLAAALAKRGIKSTAAALGAVIGQQVSATAPAGLAATVAGSALAQMSAGAAGWAGIFGAGKLAVGLAGAVAVAGITAYALQSRSNAALRSELVALRQQQQAIASLRSENRQLAANLAEVDSLRRDDAELKELAQQVADLQKAAQQRARLAQQRAAQESAERDQAEIDRMNREGNRLVEEFKALNKRANDASLSADERAEAGRAARLKLAEIQAKQREVQAYIAAAKAANPQFVAPGAQYRVRESVAGEATERRAQRESMNAENGVTNAPSASEPISLRLPNADATTLLNALEIATGRKIARDPSLFSANRVIDFNLEKTPKPEAVRALTQALQEQLNVVLETNPDGSVAAKTAPLRRPVQP